MRDRQGPRRRAVRAIVTGPELDNVATAVVSLRTGERLEIEGHTIELLEDIPMGHKVALVPLAAGDDVVKYCETIGRTAIGIRAGEHVHVHNVVSSRLPGPGGDQVHV
jgi:hypothetical protein